MATNNANNACYVSYAIPTLKMDQPNARLQAGAEPHLKTGTFKDGCSFTTPHLTSAHEGEMCEMIKSGGTTIANGILEKKGEGWLCHQKKR